MANGARGDGKKGLKADFECQYCDKAYCFKSRYEAHVLSHTKPEPYSCDKCGESFRNKYALLEHESTHTDEKGFRCKTCGKSFAHVRNLLFHEKVHRDDNPHVCRFCGRRFTHKTPLENHVRLHTGERPYRCAICNEGYTCPDNVKLHCQRQHSMPVSDYRRALRVDPPDRKRRPFTCTFCGLQFRLKYRLERHAKGHRMRIELMKKKKRLPKSFVCTHCGKQFSSLYYMRQHRRNVLTKIFGCSAKGCGKKFTTLHGLRRHGAVHKVHVEAHKCQHCERVFSSRYGVLSHEWQAHRGRREKSYACKTCGMVCSSAVGLKIHRSIHRSHSCYCGKRFKLEEALVYHQIMHSHESDRPPTNKQLSETNGVEEETVSKGESDDRKTSSSDSEKPLKKQLLSCPCCSFTCCSKRLMDSHRAIQHMPRKRSSLSTTTPDPCKTNHPGRKKSNDRPKAQEAGEESSDNSSLDENEHACTDDSDTNMLSKGSNTNETITQATSLQGDDETPDCNSCRTEQEKTQSGLSYDDGNIGPDSETYEGGNSIVYDPPATGHGLTALRSLSECTPDDDDSGTEDNYRPGIGQEKRDESAFLDVCGPGAPVISACGTVSGENVASTEMPPHLSSAGALPVSDFQWNFNSDVIEISNIESLEDSGAGNNFSEAETATVQSELVNDNSTCQSRAVATQQEREEDVSEKDSLTSDLQFSRKMQGGDNPYIIDVIEIKSEDEDDDKCKVENQGPTVRDKVNRGNSSVNDEKQVGSSQWEIPLAKQRAATRRQFPTAVDRKLEAKEYTSGKTVNDQQRFEKKSLVTNSRKFDDSVEICPAPKINDIPLIVLDDDDPQVQTSGRRPATSDRNKPKQFSKKCVHCGIGYSDLMLFLLHRGFHGPGGQFHCSACDKVFKDSVDFNIHLSSHPLHQ